MDEKIKKSTMKALIVGRIPPLTKNSKEISISKCRGIRYGIILLSIQSFYKKFIIIFIDDINFI